MDGLDGILKVLYLDAPSLNSTPHRLKNGRMEKIWMQLFWSTILQPACITLFEETRVPWKLALFKIRLFCLFWREKRNNLSFSWFISINFSERLSANNCTFVPNKCFCLIFFIRRPLPQVMLCQRKVNVFIERPKRSPGMAFPNNIPSFP